MNFVNRHFPDRDVADRISPEPPASLQHKWPFRYDAVEYVALCADIAIILFASVVSTLLCRVQSGQAATELSDALGLAAHSRDGDQVFQAMVITDSSDRDQVRRRTRLTGLSVLEMASSSRLAGWSEDRSGGPWEGPVRGAKCPQ